ncbi:mitochondrial ubiquitin ligase activator of nfkb 1-A [Acipenser oxyrinchus oxyrinchus]|uniref:RING-type E3 ubiquitin transferase n=1 Tax=Acipenser oxyrinchus oxyrinchus TaxID=40147 RepID=A0AAD8G483_ACIOX|nr:mitochondrial ubiquitin ligase activator of nfkb 1-A [Acipenser oxyrinchus oxyrinchus]
MSDSPVSPLTLICVGSSFAFSGLFYHLYQQKRQEIHKIEKIPKVQLNKDLIKILAASHRKRLGYAVIEGIVQPEGEPLASQYVPRCFGVIQKVIVREHKKVWNSITNSWNDRTQNSKESTNTVPFSLVPRGGDGGDGVSVQVVSPLEASNLCLEPVYRRLRKAQEGFVDYIAQGLSGEKPVGLQETEEMLRVGATLTGFGELVLEPGRVLKLQPPRDGQEYLLLLSDYKSFLQQHQKSLSMWKVLTALFGLAGATLLAYILYREYRRQRDNSQA